MTKTIEIKIPEPGDKLPFVGFFGDEYDEAVKLLEAGE